jgi:hypothetical protein
MDINKIGIKKLLIKLLINCIANIKTGCITEVVVILPVVNIKVVIRGINNPRDLSRLGRKAFIRSSTAVTKPEITTIYEAIRICLGIIFRISDIKRLEQVSTTHTAAPMPMALVTDVVVARVGHIPSS